MSKFDLSLLCINLVSLSAILVLLALRGANVPAILLAIGTAAVAFSKIAKAYASATKNEGA